MTTTVKLHVKRSNNHYYFTYDFHLNDPEETVISIVNDYWMNWGDLEGDVFEASLSSAKDELEKYLRILRNQEAEKVKDGEEKDFEFPIDIALAEPLSLEKPEYDYVRPDAVRRRHRA